ncbi:hypothetical protein [Paenibacillus piri]|uniref:Uncharacterized protein n=1 Tax=Paenibacillus piri TaxID=2547395 RepID=A0A4R5KYH5_9BACL|nr:hypothetical protein [Paenibacillus piri]TDG00111.1 hypothetical protein E1757_00190 [Paenibacillus piri]
MAALNALSATILHGSVREEQIAAGSFLNFLVMIIPFYTENEFGQINREKGWFLSTNVMFAWRFLS